MNAAELCDRQCIKLSEGAKELLQTPSSPREFYHALVRQDLLADARRVLAHSLNKRRALWWACQCIWSTYRNEAPPEVARVLESVIRFVMEPNEENRRLTGELGRRLKPNTLAGSLAMAAFCSEGSVSGPGLPPVPLQPYVTSRLVSVVVYLASVVHDPAHYKDHLRTFLHMGEQIARGKNLWTEPANVPVAVASVPLTDLDRAFAVEPRTHAVYI